jgi:hypothetical protein
VKNWRLSLNLLALAAAGLMIIAMLFPWWSFTLQGPGKTDVFPYLIDGPASEMIGYRRSPQMTLLTGVLIFGILITLAGGLLKGKFARVMLVVGGLLAVLAAWRLLARVGGVASRFDMPLQGHGVAVYEGFAQIEVWTNLEPGVYLIVAAGVLAIIAGLVNWRLRIAE